MGLTVGVGRVREPGVFLKERTMKRLMVAFVIAVLSTVGFSPLAHAAPHSIQRTFEWGAAATGPDLPQ
jgi:hypothetical protein